jgi:uncharacterized membrane protein
MDDTGKGGGFGSTFGVLVAVLVVVLALFAFIRISGSEFSSIQASGSPAAAQMAAAPTAHGRSG